MKGNSTAVEAALDKIQGIRRHLPNMRPGYIPTGKRFNLTTCKPLPERAVDQWYAELRTIEQRRFEAVRATPVSEGEFERWKRLAEKPHDHTD